MTYQQPFHVKDKEHTFITGGATGDDEYENDSLKAEPEAPTQSYTRVPINSSMQQSHPS